MNKQQAATMARIDFKVHTNNEAFGGVSRIEEYCAQAIRDGATAIAITDYGSAQSFAEAYKAGKKQGIKIIYGCEFLTKYLDQVHRISVWAKNQRGMEHLYGLLTEALTNVVNGHDYFLPIEKVKKGQEDLLFGLSTFDPSIFELGEKEEDEALKELFTKFDVLVLNPAIQYDPSWVKGEKGIEEILSHIVNVASEVGIRVIGTNDPNCTDNVRPEVADALAYCKKNMVKGRSSYDGLGLPTFRPFLDAESMLEAFSFLGEEKTKEIVLDNPSLLADAFEDVRPLNNQEPSLPLIDDAQKKITALCDERMMELFHGGHPSKYDTRIGKELRFIRSSGSASVFYICHLIAKKAHEDGHLVLCRGMAGSSLVAYLLGITNVDPLAPYYRCKKCHTWEGWTWEFDQHADNGFDAKPMRCFTCGGRLTSSGNSIPPEMFFGINGEKVPDIDLCFSPDYLPTIQEYLRTLFGKENIVRVGSVETLPPKTVARLASQYVEENSLEGRIEVREILDRLLYVKRMSGQHPGGFVVLPKGRRFEEFTPLQYPADDKDSEWKTTHFSFYDLIGGLYKFDLLGNVSLLHLERLLAKTGMKMEDIDLDDEKLIKVLTGTDEDTNLEHIPEFGTEYTMRVMKVTKPKTAADLIKVSCIMHGAGTRLFYEDKFLSGEVTIQEDIVTNRDDLFVFLKKKGIESETAYKIADSVRKGKGLTAEQERLMQEHDVPSLYIEACKAVNYLFPKAHSVEYLRLALALAYFKVNYPDDFEEIYFEIYR